MIQAIIADDHAVVRDGLRYLLEAQGDIHVVASVGDGRQAIQKAIELSPDILIMDISMPELNGIEAAKQIAKVCPQVKVVFLSMYATREHIFRALQSGAKGFLLKESVGEEVVKAVREIVNGSRYFSQKITDIVVDEFMDLLSPAALEDPLEKLSEREKEVLQLVVEGKSSSEIANALFLSPKTVETYRSRIMDKLGIKDLPGLIKFAIQRGIIFID